MQWIYSPRSNVSTDAGLIGGKAKALFSLLQNNYPVPEPLCITTDAYRYFVESGGLLEKINLEVNRKKFEEMRWEEMWDTALRVKSYFLSQPIPGDLEEAILAHLAQLNTHGPLVVRSSAPDEDGHSTSFAGLHESVVDVRGEEELLLAVRKVWASLWSDRALLYRQELGLDVSNSRMAVLVQPLKEGAASGIVFSRNPLDASQLAVEAVHGFNTGLVDGTIAPDRWLLDRATRDIIEHTVPTTVRQQMARSPAGPIVKQQVGQEKQNAAPLSDAQLKRLSHMALELEYHFDSPQDIEWTLAEGKIWLLQSRPVTASQTGQQTDKRSWYLSLHRSYDNLLELWHEIEDNLLPEMDRESAQMATVDLGALSEHECADELQHRLERNAFWSSVYWETFIPFAHGVRLFGDIYNETMRPDDPFEFVSLLGGQSMLGVKRNELLADCARRIAADPHLSALVQEGRLADIDEPDVMRDLLLLEGHYGLPVTPSGGEKESSPALLPELLIQYGQLEKPKSPREDSVAMLEDTFIRRAQKFEHIEPEQLLELARASYRLRDDDNIHIGRIAAQLERATDHARGFLVNRSISIGSGSPEELVRALRGERLRSFDSAPSSAPAQQVSSARLQARQLLGQPASHGLARGRARVIHGPEDLSSFRAGEILVCDAIDPTMTFFAPLAAGIVERRGGMLIHGAIIAREYGIPCVTGITDATQFIATGDLLTVDGYLGIVIRDSSADRTA